MRTLSALLVTLVAFVIMASAPPSPKPPRMTGSINAVGPLLWVKWVISATPSDSLTVDLSATGQASAHRMYLADTKSDSVSYPKPLPGASISGVVLGKNYRNGRTASAQATWSYVEPDTIVVAPRLDSVRVIPSSFTLGYSQSTTVCLVRYLSNGIKELYPVQDTMPVCQSVLAGA